jgi:hypothetical protein
LNESRAYEITGDSVKHDNVAVRLSKGMSERVQGRFGMLRTGFDKLGWLQYPKDPP